MNIKLRKIILHFLKQLEITLENSDTKFLHPFFESFFTREDLIALYKFHFDTDDIQIQDRNSELLFKMAGSDVSILEYIIATLEKEITASPTFSDTEKDTFFENRNLQLHYLHSKPTKQWDEYDVNNYYSLLWKHGKTKRVFAIFTSDVNDEDKYAVTTQPSFFFDTKEEAEAEIEKIIKEKKFKRDELKVMSLWQIQ